MVSVIENELFGYVKGAFTGGFLQLLDMSLSPCLRYHPAGGNSRIS